MSELSDVKLESGGQLRITDNSWSIDYYFEGVDGRYNGTVVSVEGNKIDDYINAWKSNFSKYLELKAALPSDIDYSTQGLMGMSIRISKFHEGVCLQSYHMPISTEKELNQVIADYEKAKEQAEKIIEKLHILNESSSNNIFEMTVSEVFEITGRGKVAHGTISKGSVKVNDLICLSDSQGNEKGVFQVVAIELNACLSDSADVGDTVGILLKSNSNLEKFDLIYKKKEEESNCKRKWWQR